jgi:hypothetical protein
MLVQPHFVVIAQRDGNSALRVFGRRFLKAIFCNDENASGGGKLDRGAKPCDTCADYDEVCLDALDRRVDIHMILV